MVKHKQVKWKDNNKPSPVLRPLPYWPDVAVTDEYAKVLSEKLVPGAMFFTVTPLARFVTQRGYAEPPYPYLAETGNHYPKGSMAIYAGIVRVEEQKNNNLLRVARHSFIISGTRYITNNLNHFMPV